VTYHKATEASSWGTGGAVLGDDELGWERRYVLLLWLSIICLIPFNLASFPSREPSPSVRNLLPVQVALSPHGSHHDVLG
jgi:hypothetical protein